MMAKEVRHRERYKIKAEMRKSWNENLMRNSSSV